jgi:hypothetical protein
MGRILQVAQQAQRMVALEQAEKVPEQAQAQVVAEAEAKILARAALVAQGVLLELVVEVVEVEQPRGVQVALAVVASVECGLFSNDPPSHRCSATPSKTSRLP